jgi:sugar lactone lactonase YvrE
MPCDAGVGLNPAEKDAPVAGDPTGAAGGNAMADAMPAMDAGDAAVVLDASATDATTSDAYCDGCCRDGFSRGTAASGARLIAPFTPSPEGVAVCPSGDVFIALDGNGEIWRVPEGNGTPERWASVGERQPAGLACDERGRLFVAIYSVRAGNPRPPTVMRIDGREDAAHELPAPSGSPLTGLNGIVAIAGLGVYASDTASGRIIRWRETGTETMASVAASNVAQANGLAFDGASRRLYVAQSANQTVAALAVAADGTLGAPMQVWRGRELLGLSDGVAVDEHGELYIASYLGGAVLRSSDGSKIAEITNPASLAFRGGTLFITDYKLLEPQAKGGLYAIELGACGAPTVAE